MNQSKIAVRYSKAVFQTASEVGATEKVKDDFLILAHFIETEPLFTHLLTSPLVGTNQKITIFVNSFQASFSPISIEFLKLICRNRREAFLADVIRNFISLYKKFKGLLSVDLHTVSPVTEELKKRIREVIQDRFHKEVQFRDFIKPELIGGFILQVDDLQYDASVSTQLKHIKDQLTEKSN